MSLTQELCINLFNSTRSIVLWFVLPLFILRIILTNVTGANFKDIGAAVKDSLLFLILVYGFEYILDLLFILTNEISPSIQMTPIRPG